MKKQSIAQTMALKAAAAIANEPDDEPIVTTAPEIAPSALPAEKPAKKVGRPRGKREVGARMTVYLDSARHEALSKLASDRGRSVHSLILEGIDTITEKPTVKAWQ